MLAFVSVLATSCQKEVPEAIAEDAIVTFNIGTPEIATRAYSDGLTATNLQYAVYDAEGNILEDLTTDGEIHGSTTVRLQLTTGNTYSVIFWAAAPNAPYTVDFGAKTMTVDYTNAACNDEARDAFYACKTFTVVGAQTETIELRRPFAQLNIGTNDYAETDKAGYLPTHSSVKVSAYSTFDFATENVTGDANLVEFTTAEINKDEVFPVAGYQYLAMNYLLVATDKEVVDVEFSYTDGADAKTRTVGSVPVQRNHRTNIYGAILTSTVDINVEIKPDFDEDDYAAAELFTVAAFGGEVILNEDVELISPLYVQANMTLNLNGYTLNNKFENAQTDVIIVREGVTLTINGEGTIEAVSGNDGYAVIADGTVIINGGTFKAGLDENNEANAVVYVRGNGKAFVNGGTFPNENNSAYVLNKRDADRATTTIEVRGGSFFKFNPANNAAENEGTNFVAEGYTSKANGDWFVVSEIVPEVYVSNAEEFENAINSGAEKIIAKGDVIYQGVLEFNNDGSRTIDMNNFKFEGGEKYAINVLNNSQLVAEGYYINGFQIVYPGAHLTFNGGTVNLSTSTTADPKNCFIVSEGGVLEIKDGEFSIGGTSVRRYYIKAMSGTKVYVKGGTFGKASTRSAGGYSAGIYGSKEDVIITGGTFGFDPTTWVAEGCTAVYDSTAKTWTVVAQ